MKQLFLFLLFSAGTLSAAVAQQAIVVTGGSSAATQSRYGTADVDFDSTGSWFLALSDGTTPNPYQKRYREDGKIRKFADEAAILNFLYIKGWEPVSVSVTTGKDVIGVHYHYLLKRRSDYQP
ncbi:hypothetical protein [Hymenobacter defluvii]|uniref:Uncharacterized protein n=1 Tax=Hymenobacter defluvii TaxID=2054411 RepID=A0ABS3TDM0_9BACT|nr:hypothetical protein [Hymenobacter defluvii]MBO3271744.1 hypothetical protein [Hymenobacter defluvii]